MSSPFSQNNVGAQLIASLTGLVQSYQSLRNHVIAGTVHQRMDIIQEEEANKPELNVLFIGQLIADKLANNAERLLEKESQLSLLNNNYSNAFHEVNRLNAKIRELERLHSQTTEPNTVQNPSAWNRKLILNDNKQNKESSVSQEPVWTKEVIVLQATGSQTPATLFKATQDLLENKAEELNITARETQKGIQVTCRSKDKVSEVKRYLLSIKDAVHVNAAKFAPLVKVMKIPINMEDATVLTKLKKHNAFMKDLKEEQMKFFNSLSHTRTKEKTVVFQTDGQTLKNILLRKSLKIGLSTYPVSEHVILTQCTRCLDYGHKKENCQLCNICLEEHNEDNCKNQPVIRCMKCAGNHLAKDCNTKELKWSVCSNDPETKKRQLPVNHRVGALSCHVKKRLEKKKKEATTYGEECLETPYQHAAYNKDHYINQDG